MCKTFSDGKSVEKKKSNIAVVPRILKKNRNDIKLVMTEAICSDFNEHNFIERNQLMHGRSKIIFRSKN